MTHAIEIIKASREHAAGVTRMIRACTQMLRREGIFQWDDMYPCLEVVEADAREGSLYIAVEDGVCRGAVTLNEAQEDAYRRVRWRGPEPVLVVHRLCVDPASQGRGIAGHLMDFAEMLAVQRGFAGIRLDAYSGNPRAVNLYSRRGYRMAGEVFFPRRAFPFYCFEKTFDLVSTGH